MSKASKGFFYFLFAFCIAFLGCSLWADDWPMLRHDAQNSGYTSQELRPPLKRVWRVRCANGRNTSNLGGLLCSSGLICVQRYAGSEGLKQDAVLLFDNRSGKLVQSIASARALYLGGNTLVLAKELPDKSSEIQCVDLTTNRPRWSYRIGGFLVSVGGAVLWQDVLYCSINCRSKDDSQPNFSVSRPAIVALRLTDGKEIASYTHNEGDTAGPPACNGNAVFLPIGAWGTTADIQVLDTQTLAQKQLWVNAGTAYPMSIDEFLITQGFGIDARCVNKESGKVVWIYRCLSGAHCVARHIGANPVIIEYSSQPKSLVALNAANGNIIWRRPMFIGGLAAGSGRYVYAGGWNEHSPGQNVPAGGFYCLDSTTGKLVWKYQHPHLKGSSVIVSENALYALDSDGYLYKFLHR